MKRRKYERFFFLFCTRTHKNHHQFLREKRNLFFRPTSAPLSFLGS